MEPRFQYLIPPGLTLKDLPPEIRAGLRLCAKIAARITRRQAGLQEEKAEAEAQTPPGA